MEKSSCPIDGRTKYNIEIHVKGKIEHRKEVKHNNYYMEKEY